MHDTFEIAYGTIVGRDHLYTGRGTRKTLIGTNNQDGFRLLCGDDYIIAVVSDGCGSSNHSEVGAGIGAHLVVETIYRNLEKHYTGFTSLGLDDIDPFLERVRLDVLAHLRILANSMSSGLSRIVSNNFFFTILGAIVSWDHVVIFSIGDGCFFVNGEMTTISFPENTPPYIAYGITGSELTYAHPSLLHFQVHKVVPTPDVETLLIGTDGLTYLINAGLQNIPGKQELIGPVSQFWEDDCYFANEFMVTRKLTLVNRDHLRVDWENKRLVEEQGKLRDDTTLVVIRRKEH
jgi:hypothetical protein